MRTWRVLEVSLLTATLTALAGSGAPVAAAAEAVRVGLNFLPNGIHVGFFAARELGWYREAGLEVEIQKGEGSSDAGRRIGSGVVDFAMADLMLTPFAAKEGIGHYEEKKVRQTRDLTLKPRGTDPETMAVQAIYTNEFLPRLFPRRGNL